MFQMKCFGKKKKFENTLFFDVIPENYAAANFCTNLNTTCPLVHIIEIFSYTQRLLYAQRSLLDIVVPVHIGRNICIHLGIIVYTQVSLYTHGQKSLYILLHCCILMSGNSVYTQVEIVVYTNTMLHTHWQKQLYTRRFRDCFFLIRLLSLSSLYIISLPKDLLNSFFTSINTYLLEYQWPSANLFLHLHWTTGRHTIDQMAC